jgi:hypothetical protein
MANWESIRDHPTIAIGHVGKAIAERGMNKHFVSKMAHTLPTSFADSILFLVMGGGSNQLDVVLMEEGVKLDGQELAARIDVKFSKVLSKVVIGRWAVIDLKNLKLIHDIARAQSSRIARTLVKSSCPSRRCKVC